MSTLTGEIFVAWTNEHVASGATEDEAIQRLFAGEDKIKPFRVTCFSVQLPEINTSHSGTLLPGDERPKLRVVGGTDT